MSGVWQRRHKSSRCTAVLYRDRKVHNSLNNSLAAKTTRKQLAGTRPLWHVRLTVAHGKTAAAPRKPFGLRVRFSAQQAGQVSTQEPASPPTDSWPRSCLADEPSTLRRTTTANQLITRHKNTQRRRHRRIASSYLCEAVPTTQEGRSHTCEQCNFDCGSCTRLVVSSASSRPSPQQPG